MTEILQKAIDCLQIRDVYLRSSQAFMSEDFEPQLDQEVDNLNIRTKHIVTQSSVLELEFEDENPIHLFRVYVDLGVLWTGLEEGESDDEEPDDVKAKIEAVIVAEYQMAEDPGEEALHEFALRNASYHVWPYWREFVATQTMRMNIPKLVMPAVQFASNSKTKNRPSRSK